MIFKIGYSKLSCVCNHLLTLVLDNCYLHGSMWFHNKLIVSNHYNFNSRNYLCQINVWVFNFTHHVVHVANTTTQSYNLSTPHIILCKLITLIMRWWYGQYNHSCYEELHTITHIQLTKWLNIVNLIITLSQTLRGSSELQPHNFTKLYTYHSLAYKEWSS